MSVSAALPLLPVGIELGGSALCLAEVRKAMIFKHRAHETHSYGNLHQRLIQQLVTGGHTGTARVTCVRERGI